MSITVQHGGSLIEEAQAASPTGVVGHATLYLDPGVAAARVTNLAASRLWPARGFQLTHIRLVRRLPDL